MCDRAAAAGVSKILAVGGCPNGNEAALAAAAARPAQVAAAVGLDRAQAGGLYDLAAMRELARGAGVAAIGETGLDYHYDAATAAAQRELFDAMLALARDVGLPSVVHTRDAAADTLAALSAHGRAWRGDPSRIGVIHCFTGDWPLARALLDLGWHLSISGIATFRNAHNVREIAARVPADRLLIETDSPWLSPAPGRRRPNEPAYLPQIAAAVAAARQMAVEDVARITFENAVRLFGVRDSASGESAAGRRISDPGGAAAGGQRSPPA